MTLAQDYLNRQISLYRNSTDTEGVDRTVRSVLEDIWDGKLAELVADVRRLHNAIPALPDGLLPDDRRGIAAWKKSDPDAHGVWVKALKLYNAAKGLLPAFITAGTFRPGHRHGEKPPPKHLERFPDCASGLLEHSGLIIVDLDHLMAHDADLELLLLQFAAHPAVIGAFVSPSDDGIKVLMAVDPVPWDDESHVRAWAGGRDALAGIYTDIDESGKNISRICFQSYDPTCYIAPDDKPITPCRMTEPEAAAEPEQAHRAKPKGRPHRKPTLDEVEAALTYLAAEGTGADDNALVGVGTCLKSLGHDFAEFDQWAAAAGCSCTDRKARWASFKDSDKDYSAILNMAANQGWNGMGKGKRQRTSRAAALPPSGRSKAGEEGGTWFRIGEHIGQHLQPTWRYLDRAEGPTWARFQDGCWQEVTTQDRALIGFISERRYRFAGELEAGWRDGADQLGKDRLWNAQKHAGSDLWDGLRKACRGQVPEPLPYHVAAENGCVDLVTGDLHPHRPECGQRGLTAGRYLPEGWERLSALLAAHLAHVFTTETQRAYLELIGLSMTGEAATYRGLVLIKGKERSGKGGAVRLQRKALGQRSAAINADWLSRRAADIDAESANLVHRRPDSISITEVGADSLNRHRKKILSAFGGEDELSARRPHGATITGILTGLWWSSCVEIPQFDVGDGISERLAVLATIGKLSPRVKRPERQTFTQDLLDAVVTGAILTIRTSGFFDGTPGGYVAPGGPRDTVTAEGLAEMDPLAAWLERLPDSWDRALVEEARAQAQDDLEEEITATRFGNHINSSERWSKERKKVDGVKAFRLILAGGDRVPGAPQVFF